MQEKETKKKKKKVRMKEMPTSIKGEGGKYITRTCCPWWKRGVTEAAARSWLAPLLDTACDRLAFVLGNLFDLAMERSFSSNSDYGRKGGPKKFVRRKEESRKKKKKTREKK